MLKCLVWVVLPQFSPGKGHEEGVDHGKCFLLTCHWHSILRVHA